MYVNIYIYKYAYTYALVNLLFCSFHSRDRGLQIKLFNCYVHPILEFNSPILSSHPNMILSYRE